MLLAARHGTVHKLWDAGREFIVHCPIMRCNPCQHLLIPFGAICAAAWLLAPGSDSGVGVVLAVVHETLESQVDVDPLQVDPRESWWLLKAPHQSCSSSQIDQQQRAGYCCLSSKPPAVATQAPPLAAWPWSSRPRRSPRWRQARASCRLKRSTCKCSAHGVRARPHQHVPRLRPTADSPLGGGPWNSSRVAPSHR